ncbi:MAG: ATP-binding protein, partial [Candidatus Thorarchaeota archaeon]
MILADLLSENRLIRRLNDKNGRLYQKFLSSEEKIRPLLSKYERNFPEYTDHSIEHSKTVLKYADELLTDNEIDNLSPDEIYILLCACLFHDVGMCLPEEDIEKNYQKEFQKEKSFNPDLSFRDFIRKFHHIISHDFVLREWQDLDIENYEFAKAIALVAQGHRQVDLLDIDVYELKYFVRPGRDFVCLPYLACITRIADELDITHKRTPELIRRYYYPNKRESQEEFEKHRATTLVNFQDHIVYVKAKCENQEIFNVVNGLCDKVQQTLDYCQKVIRHCPSSRRKSYLLTLYKIEPRIEPIGFIPKTIGFTFDVDNVFRTLVGGKLYGDKYIAIREALQNAIDTCSFKKKVSVDYNPKIIMNLNEGNLSIKDNGFGMDDFIVKNYFGRLAKSYYQKEDIKENYDAIAQFGIGVFSYFMICNHFQIKTRFNEKDPLNFICYNSPDKYFHFKKDNSDIDEGTEIIFHLNDEVKSELNMAKLENLVKYYIRFVNIPIIIHEGDRRLTIFQEDYAVNIKGDLIKALKPMYRTLSIEYFSIELDTEDYKGICGILIKKDSSDQYIFESFVDKFESGFDFNIAICYKGIFLRYLASDTLSQLIGKINVKTFQNVNLERTSLE